MENKYILEPINFTYKELNIEPFISKKQFDLHYEGHYMKYISNFNKSLNESKELQKIYSTVKDLSDSKHFRNTFILVVIEFYKNKPNIFNNIAQIYNHEQYWNSLTDTKESTKSLNLYKNKLFKDENEYQTFYNNFIDRGIKEFGSGWLWIILKDNKLDVITTHDAIVPVEYNYLACIDLWEHAYYVDYEYKRKEYLINSFKLLDWNKIYDKFNQYKK
jgi:Fe-Mn family superoxide dismutase